MNLQELILKILYVEKKINNKPLSLIEIHSIINNPELLQSYLTKFEQLKNI
jgi:hypothetical protein